jgi:regulator of replication initiation timing
MSEAQEEKKKGKRIILILLILVGLLSGGFLFLAKVAFLDNVDELETINRGKRSAEDRFAKLNGDIEKAEALLSSIGITDLDSNSVLTNEVQIIKALRKEKLDKISKLKSQIEELISASGGQAKNFSQLKAFYTKLKTEVYLLRSEVKKLKAKNQALIAENRRLKDENKQLGTDLNGERQTSAALAQERDGLQGKVNVGKRLITYDIVAEGIKIRRNGKEKPTTRASRADKIRVVFTIAKNEIAAGGTKDVFLRVVGPDDKVITDGGSNFEYKGKEMGYTSKEGIDYQNTSTDVYMYATNLFGGQGFSKGNYKIEVYCENVMIGFSAVTLK